MVATAGLSFAAVTLPNSPTSTVTPGSATATIGSTSAIDLLTISGSPNTPYVPLSIAVQLTLSNGGTVFTHASPISLSMFAIWGTAPTTGTTTDIPGGNLEINKLLRYAPTTTAPSTSTWETLTNIATAPTRHRYLRLRIVVNSDTVNAVKASLWAVRGSKR